MIDTMGESRTNTSSSWNGILRRMVQKMKLKNEVSHIADVAMLINCKAIEKRKDVPGNKRARSKASKSEVFCYNLTT